MFENEGVVAYLLIKSIHFSQQSNDDWAGFESYSPAAATTTISSTTTTKESRRSGKTATKASDNDLGSLDVKSSKGTVSTAAAAPKKPEDDAWDLLNN